MRRYLKLHSIFIKQDLKKLMEYKVDFLLGALGFLLGQAVQIFCLGVIFSTIPALCYTVGGKVVDFWTFEEVLFIYGFSLIPKGIDHLFFDNLWGLGYWIVDKGDFDKYLTRPINSWFYVLCEKFCVDALGRDSSGYSSNYLQHSFNARKYCRCNQLVASTSYYSYIAFCYNAFYFNQNCNSSYILLDKTQWPCNSHVLYDERICEISG